MNQLASPMPWNSDDWTGALWSALTPLVATLVGNGLIFTFGTMADPNYAAVSFAPPGWVVGTAWSLIYPAWGLARWRAWTSGPDGRREAGWAVALITWGLAYPVGALFWTTTVSAVANGLTLALAAVVVWRLRSVSRSAALLVAPSLAWLVFATYFGYAAARIAGGA